MRIGLDMDGVLARFNENFAQYFIQRGFDIPVAAPDFPKVWDWPEAYGVPPDVVREAWKQAHRNEEFFLGLPAYGENVSDALDLQHKHTLYFITSRSFHAAKRVTEAWLLRQGFFNPTVLVSKRKGDVARGLELDVVIDDKPENVLDVNLRSDSLGLLMDRPYNRDEYEGATRIMRVRDLFHV